MTIFETSHTLYNIDKVLAKFNKYSGDHIKNVLKACRKEIVELDADIAAQTATFESIRPPRGDIRKNVHDPLIDAFVSYFAQEELPKLQPYTAAESIDLYRNNSRVHAKATCMAASIMQILEKTKVFD